jgi:hypothetical protein
VGDCYRSPVQAAGLQIGTRAGPLVDGGDSRIGKVNIRSNHYFISQHAHGQQRTVDYSSLDDNNTRQVTREHLDRHQGGRLQQPTQELRSLAGAQALANAIMTQCRASKSLLVRSAARESFAVVLMAGLVSAKCALH